MARWDKRYHQGDPLSAREENVLALLAEGLSRAEIAERLGMRKGTLNVDIAVIFRKLGVRNRVQAQAAAQAALTRGTESLTPAGPANHPEGGTPPAEELTRASEPLTTRELEILALVAGGRRSEDIATELGIAPATVKSHLTRVYRKLGVRNRVQAARHYVERLAPSRDV